MHRKRPKVPRVEPDLPITPMLDMSFQLMAFFLLTFRPMPLEAQMALALPKEDGGPSQLAPSLDPAADEELIVQVYAADNGGLADITAAPRTGSFSLGQDTGALFKYLQDKAKAARLEQKPPPKLRLEIAERLNYQYVVKLIDEARRAGFDRISPVLLNPTGQR
jgi:biopolymer transport protein ExbD